MLEVKNLSKKLNGFELNNISFKLERDILWASLDLMVREKVQL